MEIRVSKLICLLVSFVLVGALSPAEVDARTPDQGVAAATSVAAASEVVLLSEVAWEALNPARGDQSPRAGTLWGDRNGSGPTGFLVEFVDGFSSPPHIHNVSYRGVVIHGRIHNDDPGAVPMWMPPGSFWTQPKGEPHITAATGSRNLVYVEIEDGPYLVRPPDEAFDAGERPINVDASNLVWVDASILGSPGTPTSSVEPEVAFLWGDPLDDHPSGTMLRLPVGFSGALRSQGSTLRVVVVEGQPRHRVPGADGDVILEPGSGFRSTGEAAHVISSEGEDCILYVRAGGRYEVVPMASRN